jgi:glycosyltransferase involved in cell wall biosynthesis
MSGHIDSTGARRHYDVADITVVVPTRNAAALLPGCLSSIKDSGITRIVVVDGLSTDGSREIAENHGAVVLSDGGGGLPLARSMGVAAAQTSLVALVDADVVFPPAVLAQLLTEFNDGKYVALQAGLSSVSGPGYWGRALVFHHRTGRSRWWFGLVATLVERDALLKLGFDAGFPSGEDIELRWRMESMGMPAGVSRQAIVEHRFAGDDFAFARDQFLMDGTGLGLMIRKHGWRGVKLALLPLAAAARGAVVSLVRGKPQWLPYFVSFGWFNYVGMKRGLTR